MRTLSTRSGVGCVLWSLLGLVSADISAPAGMADTGWISKANNAFAVDLYAKLATGKTGNLFFSPNSIETALAMTYAGARGSTAEQMAKVLHLPAADENVHRDFGEFLKELNATKTPEGKPRGFQLAVANALWGQQDFGFLPEFMDLLKAKYGAGLNKVDFKSDSEGVRRKINVWVEEATRDKIKDLIGQGVLTPMTRLVLTNAIYFKGNWAAQFDKGETREEPFHVSAEDKKKVSMMHRMDTYGYMEEESFQALRLPYSGHELSMIILLPRKVDGLSSLEQELTSKNLSAWLSKLREEKVAVSLPRFKTTAQFQLNSALMSLGMSDAFDVKRADFSGMTGERDLMISDVIHKAFVDVNEEGTEATAATAVVMALRAAPASPQPVFRADHPFLFLIQDDKSGTILFMGRLVDPAN